MSLDDYISPEETPDGTPESAIREILGTYDRRSLLMAPLAVLNRQCDRQEALERLTDYYRSALAETLRRRLDAAMSRRERSAGTPRIVACQCVLAAMKGCCAIR